MGASASAPAHFPAPVRVHARPGIRVGIGGTSPPAGSAILTAGRRLPYAGPHHEIHIVRTPARVRVRDPPFVAVVYLARGGGLPAMSVAGTVEGAAQDRMAPLCARAALDLGRPLGPGPGPGPGSALALDLTLGLVLAHVPARARVPHHTLRILRVAVGPDPIAGVVEAIVETISGTAGLARLPPKSHDGQIIRLHVPLRLKSSPDMTCRCRLIMY
jgi:hypothetical protein